MRYIALILFFATTATANQGPVSFDTIYSMLVDNHYCVSCHSGQYGNKGAGLDMDYKRAYDNLVGFPSTQVRLNRVEPGDPENSYIVQKLKGTANVGYQMPMGGPYLTAEEIELVEEWIRQGAGRD